MLRIILILFILCNYTLLAGQDANNIDGEVIIQLEQGATINGKQFKSVELLNAPLNIYLLKYDVKRSYNSLATDISQRSDVLNIFPNKKVTLRQTSNDKRYSEQWNLMKIDIERAWNVTTGGKTALGEDIVVAILDSGYDISIPDLAANLYYSKIEKIGDSNGDGCPGDCGVDDDNDGKIDEDLFDRIPGHPLYNNIAAADDDENGYIDDIRGLNLDDLSDNVSVGNHGTSVAGIIGAKGNNTLAVAGINWDVDLMLLSNVGNIGQIIRAYTYIYDQRKIYNDSNGAKGANIVVTNFSSGIDNEFGEDYPSWCSLYDLLGSVGILSVGATTNRSTNVDEEGDLPSTCTSPYLITVTNLTKEDAQATSGFGPIHVDIGAPGNGAVTLEMGESESVGTFSGTSSAAPHVAGAIALLHSIPCEGFATYYKENPEKVLEIKDYILNSVDPIPDLVGRTVAEGRLNIYSTMVALKEFCPSNADGGELAITKVYPNPSYVGDGGEVIIEYDGPDGEGNYEFAIFNVLGGLIHSEEFNPPLYGERIFRITPPTLAKGVYYFVLRSDKDIASHKQVFIRY